MQSIRQIQRLNDAELEKCVPSNASWHTDYRDTAYVYIGGLPFELSEGDVLTIFSQYGNPVHVNLARDKETGKSRGFAFLKYEDQRSCDLAVDNLSGATVLGRMLSVDHTRYKLKEGEIEGAGMEEEEQEDDEDDTDREGEQRRKRRRTSSPDERPHIKEELELAKLLKEHDDDDPMKAYLVKEKREEVAEALKALSMNNGQEEERRKHRSHKHDGDAHKSRHRHHSSDRTRHKASEHYKTDRRKDYADPATYTDDETRPGRHDDMRHRRRSVSSTRRSDEQPHRRRDHEHDRSLPSHDRRKKSRERAYRQEDDVGRERHHRRR